MTHQDLHGVFSREFEIFLTLAQTRSVKQTAEKFGLSLPSISRLMNELEARLHVSLFDRSCKPMRLTPEGRWLVDEIKPGIRRIAQSLEGVHSASFFKPYLRIGFIDSFSYDIAPVFIERMLPRLQGVSCLTGGADRLIERLYAQEVDVILTIDPCFDIPELRRHLLLREPSVLLFPREEKYCRAGSWSWRELSVCGLPFIRNYCSSGGGKLESVHFTTHDLDIVSRVHSDSIGMREKLVARGNGWAIVRPLSLLQHAELIAQLHIFRTPPPIIMRNIYVLARSMISSSLFAEIVNVLADILRTETLPKLRSILGADVIEGAQIFGLKQEDMQKNKNG